LGIGTIAPATVCATRGAALAIRGSSFQSGANVTINGKSTSVTFKDANTLLAVTPSLTPGSQQITITNPDGESVSLDAAFTGN
jgi:IPT/TIG domain-containing protein